MGQDRRRDRTVFKAVLTPSDFSKNLEDDLHIFKAAITFATADHILQIGGRSSIVEHRYERRNVREVTSLRQM